MMGRLLEKRWVCVLLSVLLAIIIWAYVRVSVDPTGVTVIHNVRVDTTGTNVLTSQGLTISGLSPQVVELRVEGPNSARTDLLRERNNLSVRLDVSSCVEGENVLHYRPVWPENINQEELSIQDQEPASIVVTVEKLYSETFDVQFQLDGKVARGYQMGTPAIEPEKVIISGPVEQVNQVDQVVAILKDSELDDRFAGELPLTLLDNQGNPLTDLEVTLSAQTAYVVVPVVVAKEVGLTVQIVSGGGATEKNAKIDIEPQTLVVSGSEADLVGLEEISLGTINLSEVVTTNEFTFPINLDHSLVNESGITDAKVTVTVEGLDTEAFAVTNIRTINEPAGHSVEVVTQSVLVMVRGPAEDLAGITASQLSVVADLSNVTTVGARRVPVKVYLNGVSTVGVIGDYTIMVNVNE